MRQKFLSVPRGPPAPYLRYLALTRSWRRNAAGYLSFVLYRRKAVRYPKGIMPYFNSAALEAPDFSRGRVHVGTVLYLVPSHTSSRRYGKDVKKATVSKVARKYIYVDVDKDVYDSIKLNKNNLDCIDTFNGERLWKDYTSMEEIENAKEKETLLKQFGQLFSLYGKGNQLTLHQLRAIKAIVEEEILK